MFCVSVLLVAGWMCLFMFHPHELTVEANNAPVVIEQWSQSRPLFGRTREISIEGDSFILDGKQLQVISGSVHYYRMPAEYWQDRLRKLKAAGFNAVSTYVEWSFHEPEERQYRFQGDHDVARFVRLAADEGLLVLLRPGPYICAERDLGGLPYWLLHKYSHIVLRTTDKDFINETKIWFVKLFEHLTPLLYENGGPIILVQVENEYGSFGNDMAYKIQVRDIIESHVNNKALLYTTDGISPDMIRGGAVPRALTTIDFGVSYEIRTAFRALREIMPQGPLMNSEFYSGWLTHWGESLQHVNKNQIVRSLRDFMNNKINFNVYVFFGGTNFEFTAGANFAMYNYLPDITSYDYDAPLNEAGDPTPKYYAIRNLLELYNPNIRNITPPIPAPKGAYGKVTFQPQINLLSAAGRSKLGKRYSDVTGPALPTFERLRQRAGLVLYETTLGGGGGLLEINKPRDRIYVYVDGELKGIIDRMTKRHILWLATKRQSVLSLLVENQGRINYGRELQNDQKGILGQVKFNNISLTGTWIVTGYPLECISSDSVANQPSNQYGPVIFKSTFVIEEQQEPLDTFIDTYGWGKGFVWINGHNLGRYWPGRGPQVTLYVPGVWLVAAPQHNIIQILEFENPANDLSIDLIDHPILNRTSSWARLADPNSLIFNL